MNYTKEVAKMLGVEIGEVFTLKGKDGREYKFMPDGLWEMNNGVYCVKTLASIIYGNSEIIKKP